MYIGNMLEELLVKNGYEVLRAYSGTEALLVYDSQKIDLVLLDLMLPGLNGEEVLPKISNTPVIIVSAKIDMENKVNLLFGGAVDYVTKPFNTAELLARISVHLRNKQVVASKMLEFDDIKIDTDSQKVCVLENEVKLTRTEYAILKLLVSNCNIVVTKSAMLDNISMDTPDCTESSLKIHVSNLRKKLRAYNDKEYIEAVWGIGFKLKS